MAKMCMAYNTTVQSTTGLTPIFLMYGRQARLPVDVMHGVEPAKISLPWTGVKSRLSEVNYRIQDMLRNRRRANSRAHAHHTTFIPSRYPPHRFQ